MVVALLLYMLGVDIRSLHFSILWVDIRCCTSTCCGLIFVVVLLHVVG